MNAKTAASRWCALVSLTLIANCSSVASQGYGAGSVVNEVNSGKCLEVVDASTADGANVQQNTCNGLNKQKFRFEPVGGFFQIRPEHSQKCLGVVNGDTNAFASVVQQSCDGSQYQLWTVTGSGSNRQMRAAHSDLCLDVLRASVENGANIIQYFCGETNVAQLFRISAEVSTEFTGSIVNEVNSNKCLEIEGNSLADNANVHQWTCHGNPNQRFRFERVGAYFRIRPEHSNKCIGVENGNTNTLASVIQQPCGDNVDHQLWRVSGSGASTQIRVVHTDMCLDVLYASKDNGASLIQYPCTDGNVAQQFRIDAGLPADMSGSIVNVGNSNKCVEVEQNSVSDGANVQQRSCFGTPSQLFRFQRSGDYFQIRPEHAVDKCIGVLDGSTTAFVSVVQQTCDGSNFQLWRVIRSGDNVQIRVVHTDMCLDVARASVDDGASLVQYPCSDGNIAQIFRIEARLPENLAGSIVNEASSGKCLDIAEQSSNDGANVHQWTCSGVASQQFRFEQVGEYYRIKPEHSEKCIGVENGATNQMASVVQQPCTDANYQLWRVSGSGASTQLRVAHTNMCLDVMYRSLDNGASLIQWPCSNPNPAQQFRVNARISGELQTSAWEGPYSMPLIAAAAANLPDGRILAWSAWAKYSFGGENGKTYTAIFDPLTGQSTEALIENTNHDMFCPGTAVLPDGRIMVTGGSASAATSFYTPSTNSWSVGPRFNIPRGYHSMTVLADGSVFTLGGSWSGGTGNKHGEVWSPITGQWSRRPGIRSEGALLTNDERGIFVGDNHMWLFCAPNGKVFHAGPARQMHWIDTAGNGSVQPSVPRGDDTDSMNGNAVMFDIGKILKVGGALHYTNSDANDRAYVIDINNDAVTVERVGNLSGPRALGNCVPLPSGEVVVIGGQTRAMTFEDVGSILTAEIWSPVTKQFTKIATMTIPRNYHSSVILMNDGRIWAGGGGLCGNCPANHADAEILTPPYLEMHNTDGTPKARPVIISAPSSAVNGDVITVTMDTSGRHTFALMRQGAVTHSVNNDNRRIPLSVVSQSDTEFELAIPGNSAIALPGMYFLFALNDDGVPSVATNLMIKTG